jgi:hypothetical protein
MITAVVHPIVRSLAANGPVLPTLADGLSDAAGRVFEPKWHGWRCLAVVDDGRVDLAPYFAELTHPPRCRPEGPCHKRTGVQG